MQGPGAVAAGGFWGLDASWNRLPLAAAASVALHGAALLGLHPEWIGGGGGRPAAAAPLVVRFASSPETAMQGIAVSPSAEPAVQGAAGPQAAPSQPLKETSADAPPVRMPEAGIPLRALAGPLPPRYYLSSELDKRPTPLGDIFPEFPKQAVVRTGRVRLRVLIDERGIPDRVTVLKAEPPEVFDASALAAFGNARYSPGILNGQPVKSELLLEVEYEDPSNRQSRFASDRAGY